MVDSLVSRNGGKIYTNDISKNVMERTQMQMEKDRKEEEERRRSIYERALDEEKARQDVERQRLLEQQEEAEMEFRWKSKYILVLKYFKNVI